MSDKDSPKDWPRDEFGIVLTADDIRWISVFAEEPDLKRPPRVIKSKVLEFKKRFELK